MRLCCEAFRFKLKFAVNTTFKDKFRAYCAERNLQAEIFVRYEHVGNRQPHEHWYCLMLDRVVPGIKKNDVELVYLSMDVQALLRAVQVI